MPTCLDAEDVRSILTGAAFYGSGGGGSLTDGLRLLDDLVSKGRVEIQLIDLGEMSEDECAVMVAEIGSPKAFRLRSSFPETVTAVEVMREALERSGGRPRYLMSGELGGMNTAVPLCAAALLGIPFVDADGSGRAVPELRVCLYPMSDIPLAPLVLAAETGDVAIIALADSYDYAAAEKVARHFCMAYGMAAAFCTWPADKSAIERYLVPGAVSRAKQVGETIRSATDMSGLAASLKALAGVHSVARGRIMEITTTTESGFDFGATHIETIDTGAVLRVDFQNENLLVRNSSGQVMVTAPDIIVMVDEDTLQPVTNADTFKGEQVALFTCRAPEVWYQKAEGYGCWRDTLARAGYEGSYVGYARS